MTVLTLVLRTHDDGLLKQSGRSPACQVRVSDPVFISETSVPVIAKNDQHIQQHRLWRLTTLRRISLRRAGEKLYDVIDRSEYLR